MNTLLVGAFTGGASLLGLGAGSPELVPLSFGLFFWYVALKRSFAKAFENMHTQKSILNQLVQAPLTQVSHVHIRIGGMKPYIESLRDGQLAAQDLREQFWMAHAQGDMALDRVVQEGRGLSLGEYFQKMSPDPLHPEAAVEELDFHSYIRKEGHEIIWTLALQMKDLRFDQIKPPKPPHKKKQIEIKEPRASWEPGLVPIPIRN